MSTADELDSIIKRDYITQFRTGFVQIGRDNYFLPKYYNHYAERIENFEIYDDDIFVTSHSKTGTTWTQEMVWLIANDLNYDKTAQPLNLRFPHLEFSILADMNGFQEFMGDIPLPLSMMDSVQFTESFPRARLIKSHLPWTLLPKQIRSGTKNPKIIHVARNAKDTCISYYHHLRNLEKYRGNFEDFCRLFLAGKIHYGPFWKSVLSYWEHRNDPNVLFIKYEDMKEDLPKVIKQVAKFLNKDLNDEQIKTLTVHLSFENMKKNTSLWEDNFRKVTSKFNAAEPEQFFRSGISGNFKTEMTPEMIEKFNEWSREQLKNTGLTFDDN